MLFGAVKGRDTVGKIHLAPLLHEAVPLTQGKNMWNLWEALGHFVLVGG